MPKDSLEIPNDLLSQTEAARRFDVSRSWLIKQIKLGKLDKYGTKVSESHVEELSEQLKVQSESEVDTLRRQVEELKLERERARFQVELDLKTSALIELQKKLDSEQEKYAVFRATIEESKATLQQTVEREMVHVSSLRAQITSLEEDKKGLKIENEELKDTLKARDAELSAYREMSFWRRLIGAPKQIAPTPEA